MRTLIILFSYHHKNTEKIAKAMAKVLNAEIKKPSEVDPFSLKEYDLIGFGSGIYSAQNHPSILNFIDKMPKMKDRKAFVFSTTGAPWDLNQGDIHKNHSALIDKLTSIGFTVLGEFSCRGHNTNSFLKYFGGLNKGRPNEEDLQRAERFAIDLKKKI